MTECLHEFNYQRPKIVVIGVIIDVMRLLLRCNNGDYEDEQGASVSASLCRHEQHIQKEVYTRRADEDEES